MDVVIPPKSSFSFNEVSSISEVKPYVLRFWESEFPQVDPVISDNGEKVYDLTDLHAVLKIKKLLFEDKLSIPKAKFKLMEESIEVPQQTEHRPSFVFEPPEEVEELKLEQESIETEIASVADYSQVKEILLMAKTKIADIKQNMNWHS
jgi:DNA-binding transcriptional MerR regulator